MPCFDTPPEAFLDAPNVLSCMHNLRFLFPNLSLPTPQHFVIAVYVWHGIMRIVRMRH